MASVAHPESIVTTEWVAENLGDPGVRLVEVDVDTEAYDQGHIPGAVGWNWTSQLNDQLTRDILSAEQMGELLGRVGHRRRHDRSAVWRQQQLVRHLRLLADEDIRSLRPEGHGRRQAEVARRGQGTNHRGDLCRGRLPTTRPRRTCPFAPRATTF